MWYRLPEKADLDHAEKHGLIHRFSGILDENGINHMYSSTYKTANLLVRDHFVIAKLLGLTFCVIRLTKKMRCEHNISSERVKK